MFNGFYDSLSSPIIRVGVGFSKSDLFLFVTPTFLKLIVLEVGELIRYPDVTKWKDFTLRQYRDDSQSVISKYGVAK